MTKNLKHKPLIGEILPGSLTIGLLLISYLNLNSSYVDHFIKDTSRAIFASGIFLICAWITGTLFDSIRNGIVEVCLDWKYPINWSFFFNGDVEKVHQLEEFYFAYYVLELNFSIGMLLVMIFHLPVLCYFNIPYIELCRLPWWGWLGLILVTCVFLNDSIICMRKEIGELINTPEYKGGIEVALPHRDVYTRLKPSAVHGIGVFAVRNIPGGTNIFPDDNSNTIWIEENNTKHLAPEMRELYMDFCVKKGKKYYCPDSFNNLTVSWYINHSKDNPNVRCTNDYDFISIKDIHKGSELLVNYETYSDKPERILF